MNNLQELLWGSITTLKPINSEGELASTSNINLDFAEEPQRRSSFIPPKWKKEESLTHLRPRYVYQGATVYKLHEQRQDQHVSKFCTGSKHIGKYNEFGMSGRGVYRFPHGVIYDGFFNRKGEFHGNGVMIYPGGQKVEGFWRNGKLVAGVNFIAKDNVTFEDKTCKSSDRRFQIEVVNELKPAGTEYLTSDPTPRPIPSGCYDMGEGFFNPKNCSILGYKNTFKRRFSEIYNEEKVFIYETLLECTESFCNLLNYLCTRSIPRKQIISSGPTEQMQQWIKNNCRKAWDEPTGYRPDLYEDWTAGYREDAYRISTISEDDDEVVRDFSRVGSYTEQKDFKMYSFIQNKKAEEKISISTLVNILTLLGQQMPNVNKQDIFKFSRRCTITSEVSPSGVATPVATRPYPKNLFPPHIRTKWKLTQNKKRKSNEYLRFVKIKNKNSQ